MLFSKILSLEDIKEEPFIIQNIRWDIEPKNLMEPRCQQTPEGLKLREPIKGYVFYIDTMDRKPALFLLRHTSIDFGETIAKIDEIPQDLLTEAIEENKDRAYFGMYPINAKIEQWLKKELGVL